MPFKRLSYERNVCPYIEALVEAGADMNAPMNVCRPLVSDLVSPAAYPLGIAMGLYVDGVLPEALEAAKTLVEAGADVNNCRGVGPFPLVSTPLFSAALAIHRELPEAFDVFKSILAAGADPSECALFPEGSECPPIVELLHVLREGRVDRVEVLALITSLLEAGADVRKYYPEVRLVQVAFSSPMT